MTKIHINPKNGDAGVCHSTEGKCPFGEENHFDSLEEARKTFEGKFSSFSSISKQVFSVEDGAGDKIDLVGGKLNEKAKWIFRNGQCLALATALAKKLGTDQLATHYEILDDEEALWDDEADDFVYDENGDEVMATFANPIHVYAVDSKGDFWDVDGILDSKKARANIKGEQYITLQSIDDTTAAFGGFMSEQEYDYAGTMVSQIIPETVNA